MKKKILVKNAKGVAELKARNNFLHIHFIEYAYIYSPWQIFIFNRGGCVTFMTL